MSDPGLLGGIKILDLSQGIAGPACASILQQQGAAVVKIEPPGGDWAGNIGFAVDGFTAPVIACNAGKKSLCLDLRVAEGVAAARRLARQFDVLVQSFRPGVAARLGLGADELRAADQSLVYVSISGFGPDGPLAGIPATDTAMQAMTGLMAANRDARGLPQRVGLHIADVATAVYAAQVATAALFRRERLGAGAHVEVSLLQACAALQATNLVEAAINRGPAMASSAPSGIFRSADGHLSIAVGNDRMFGGLCDALERPAWKADPRFATMAGRLANAGELNQGTAETFVARPSAHWRAVLSTHDVLHSDVLDYAGFTAHPQVRQQKLLAEIDQPGVGRVPWPRPPGMPSDAAVAPTPSVGADNHAVLSGHGFSDAEIEALRAAGAVVDPR
jgi:crotonobetainyl-CoA:carnitine CoA-transferase CaiB-like acyl-CoA transferase